MEEVCALSRSLLISISIKIASAVEDEENRNGKEFVKGPSDESGVEWRKATLQMDFYG